MDHLVGKLLNELKSLDLDQNTLIVLWGDHGWHLGNDLKWGKHSLFERSLKSTLIIKPPGNAFKPKKIKSIVETVDLYPTLLEYCSLTTPYPLDGQSLLPLIEAESKRIEGMAFSYFKNGVSMRTPRYRMTKYYREEKPDVELFDHTLDPEENKNIADDNQEMVNELMPILNDATPAFYYGLKK